MPPTLVPSCSVICSALHSRRTSSRAPHWSRMDPTISVWQQHGHHFVCTTQFLHHPVPNSTSSSRRPLLLRSHPGCMCRAYASFTLPTSYISATYITSRFSCAFCYRSNLNLITPLISPLSRHGTIHSEPRHRIPPPTITPILSVLLLWFAQHQPRIRQSADESVNHRPQHLTSLGTKSG